MHACMAAAQQALTQHVCRRAGGGGLPGHQVRSAGVPVVLLRRPADGRLHQGAAASEGEHTTILLRSNLCPPPAHAATQAMCMRPQVPTLLSLHTCMQHLRSGFGSRSSRTAAAAAQAENAAWVIFHQDQPASVDVVNLQITLLRGSSDPGATGEKRAKRVERGGQGPSFCPPPPSGCELEHLTMAPSICFFAAVQIWGCSSSSS